MTKKLYKLMNWPLIEEIIYSESDNPHETLGPHKVGNQTLIQAYFPGAKKVAVVYEETGETFPMEIADEDGFFAVLLPISQAPAYHYLVTKEDGTKDVWGEPYRFKPHITKKDTDKYKNGIHYTIYEKLGAHPMELDGVKGTYFAVWAPNVMRASVVGDFNNWDGRVHQMRRLWDSGIFELFVPGAGEGVNYKFELKLTGGLTYLKADPYCNAAQLRPETASVIADLRGFRWEDKKFIEKRAEFQTGNVPMSVYELYLGSFAVSEDGERYANYREIAAALIPYVREMGYTHVELMPVMEHPYDASWGYQVIGYYAPTARYGSPKDFMYFVNELHKAGIGVILDWVPAHFPRDVYGLSNFDGTCLYEHLDPRQGSHPHWGTLIYNYGRPQVSNYLIANALFWVEKYHVDGIRMDAVASMLYLDYGKGDGQWIPNIYGGKENLEAIEMLKHLNSIMKKRNFGVLTIAEESTAFPKITGDLSDGGLGFDLKWNMGFMNDYLRYIQYDPYFRSHHHGELTFSMIYAYSEKFMLVFSHDEVVHGKATLIGKMPGEREQKFANLRLTYGYMMTHPGKKLLFMGQDLGEFDEWNENRCVEWELASQPGHEGIMALVKDLNHFYRTNPELYELDDQVKGFEWINNISGNESYLTFLRHGQQEDQVLLVVANFSGVSRDITTGVPFDGKYKEVFNTDDVKYGGTGQLNSRIKKARDVEWDDRPQSITVTLAPLSVSILRYIPYTEEELAQKKKQEQERAKKAAETKKRAEERAAERAAVKAAAKKAAQEAARKVMEEAEKKAARQVGTKQTAKAADGKKSAVTKKKATVKQSARDAKKR
ncbi:MAG: 1,4-alpha-glucan branching protein GlgB [Acetatifactor sp.]|nr:1,4-alpha-glucan branching protein GlgB [Acetatifactor sp.]